jgi:hypothetical protein
MCEIEMAQQLPASPLYSTIATSWTGKGHTYSISPYVGSASHTYFVQRHEWHTGLSISGTSTRILNKLVYQQQRQDVMRFTAGGLLLIEKLQSKVSQQHALLSFSQNVSSAAILPTMQL